MKVMIHATPSRMWYVDGYLAPSLRAQGIEPRIFVDEHYKGNLRACLESFSLCDGTGDEGTWHLQDDVIICRNFAERAAAEDYGVANAFCSRYSDDKLDHTGTVYPPDLWTGFPCVRIPDEMARDYVRWVKSDELKPPQAEMLIHCNRGDDFIFHKYFEIKHGHETARNIAPNLVDHVDWLIGGSLVSEWREHIVRAEFWEEPELVSELARKLNKTMI